MSKDFLLLMIHPVSQETVFSVIVNGSEKAFCLLIQAVLSHIRMILFFLR